MKQDYSIDPSMIDGQSGIIWSYENPYMISIFDDTHPLDVSAHQCNQSSMCVWYVSPLWQFNDSSQTKYALLGEWNKWTVVSRQRFLSITTNLENTQTTILVQGVISEVVSIIVYHSTLQSMAVNCSISNENGQANLIITPTSAICS
jgi:hypothetical protein